MTMIYRGVLIQSAVCMIKLTGGRAHCTCILQHPQNLSHGATLFHGVWAVGPARHGGVQVCGGHYEGGGHQHFPGSCGVLVVRLHLRHLRAFRDPVVKS